MEIKSNECCSCYRTLSSKGLGVVPGPAVPPSLEILTRLEGRERVESE